MDILKYFYDEPTALETLAPDLEPDARRQGAPEHPWATWLNAPRYYRGYVAGTNLDDNRVGLTALARPAAFADPVLDWLSERSWMRSTQAGSVEVLGRTSVRHFLLEPGATTALVCSRTLVPEADVGAVAGAERRYTVPALRRVLDQGGIVFFPEPAHHGVDWSFFSAEPMRETLMAAFRRHPATAVRRFVVPFQKARSEHKFYFEAWQLNEPLPDYIEEI